HTVGERTVTLSSFRIASLALHPLLHQAQRVVPQSIDLDRFPTPWGDHQVADFCIHPGQLVSRGALSVKTIRGIDSDTKASASLMESDDLLEPRKQALQRVAIPAHIDVTFRRMEEPKRRVRRVIKTLTCSLGKHIRDESVLQVLREGTQNIAGLRD